MVTPNKDKAKAYRNRMGKKFAVEGPFTIHKNGNAYPTVDEIKKAFNERKKVLDTYLDKKEKLDAVQV